MNKINLIIKSVTFRRIAVIFLVGFFTRIVVNLVCEINVFKDYTSLISLVYYALFACFTGLVCEHYVEGNSNSLLINHSDFLNKLSLSNNDKSIGNEGNNGNAVNSLKGAKIIGRPSAGLRGLYGDNMVYVTKNTTDDSVRGLSKVGVI
jgi:hypothetical protein